MGTAPTGAGSLGPRSSVEDIIALGKELQAQRRMGELAQEWLLDHEFGRCSCAVTPGSCKGRQLIDTIGGLFYAKHGRDRA